MLGRRESSVTAVVKSEFLRRIPALALRDGLLISGLDGDSDGDNELRRGLGRGRAGLWKSDGTYDSLMNNFTSALDDAMFLTC